jgi:asparagine synthase (glutamine-hydrolysing)
VAFTQTTPFASLSLRHDQGLQWHAIRIGTIDAWAKGFAFHAGTVFGGQGLARLCAESAVGRPKALTAESLVGLLQKLNGSFALVVERGKWLFAGVDRVRSIPLFYGMRDGHILLSDDGNWIREHVGDIEPDPPSVDEFMLAGYVTGGNTLYPNTKQLRAGECLWYERSDGAGQVTTRRYYRWVHGDYIAATERELSDEMDRMHLRVFGRLLESTRGRTIVVPLSGGYDSRLIVTMLKRLGRDGVICFSYGRPGNKESEVSQRVATKLGYPWMFVPYRRNRWREWFASEEMREYARYSSSACSIPHIQDWPAVWMLRKRNEIPDDSVFVPGHSGDFVAGSHIPTEWGAIAEVTPDMLLDRLRTSHYHLWAITREAFLHRLRPRLWRLLTGLTCTIPEKMVGAYECWDWEERQSKFIVNSIRAYEFWGYEWRIPLWDNDVMDYWRMIPLPMRVGTCLYDRHVEGLFQQHGIGADSVITKHEPRRRTLDFLLEPARRVARHHICARMREQAKWLRSYWSDPMEWYGSYPLRQHVEFALNRHANIGSGFSINSFVVLSEFARIRVVPPLLTEAEMA